MDLWLCLTRHFTRSQLERRYLQGWAWGGGGGKGTCAQNDAKICRRSAKIGKHLVKIDNFWVGEKIQLRKEKQIWRNFEKIGENFAPETKVKKVTNTILIPINNS